MSSVQEALPGTAALQRTAKGSVGRDLDRMLDGLNGPQREAVVHEGGPAADRRRRRLGQDPGAHPPHRLPARPPGTSSPGEILAITFTNKAAGEMKERVAALVGPRARAMWVTTFHSACVRILRAEAAKLGLKSTFSIYDAADSAADDAGRPRARPRPEALSGRGLAAQVSNLKNELIDEEGYVRGQTAADQSGCSPRPTRSTSGGCARRTRWTSTT